MEKKIVIATHYMVYGVSSALRDYLINKKVERILHLGLPLSFNKDYSYDLYQKGKLVKKYKFTKKLSLGPFDYFFEFIVIILQVFLRNEKQDIFIGFDPLNSYAGLFLKKIGRVRRVILFTMDFTPKRFNNSLINFLYHYIEKVSVYNVDEVWDVSPRMAKGREKFLKISQNAYKRKIVQVGMWHDKIKIRKFSEIKKHQLLFLGTLFEKQGVQLVLEAMPDIIKQIPDFKFLILGGGEYENELKKIAKNPNLNKHVEFRGWISDRKLLDEIIGESACAAACYKPEKEKLYNFSYYADPGKIKDYISAGLPIILTDVPYNAKDIDKKRCGILVKYNKEDIANAVVRLMKNEKILEEYRNNVLDYSKELNWNLIFDKAFEDL